jgi:putative peptidoglycan lipid II flippase
MSKAPPRPPGREPALDTGTSSRRPRVGRSAAVLASGTLVSRITGFVKLLVLVHLIGFTYLDDAYNLANTTPNIIYDLAAGGVLAATIVPVFVDRLARTGREDADREISAVCTVAFVVLVVATVVLVALAPDVIRLYDLGTVSSPAVRTQARVATELLRLVAIEVLAYGTITLLTALLNAERRFAAPAFAPVVNNLVVIAVLLTARVVYGPLRLATASAHPGLVVLLGLGTSAGVVLQAIAIVPALRSWMVRLRPVLDVRARAVRDIVRLSGWTIGFVVANQVALFVVLTLAHGLDAGGGATAWTSAYTFFQLPVGVLAVSVMNALEPELAEDWSRDRRRAFRRHLSAGLRATLAVILPTAVAYALLARPLITATLSSTGGTAGTGGLLAALALGLPGFVVFLYLMRAWQARRDTRTVFLLYLLENGLNIVLAVVLTRLDGLFGLGLSYGIAYSVGALVAGALLRREGLLGGDPLLPRTARRVVAASLPMAAVIEGVVVALPDHGRLLLLAKVVAAIIAGGSVFAATGAAGAFVAGRRGRASGRRRRRSGQWSRPAEGARRAQP